MKVRIKLGRKPPASAPDLRLGPARQEPTQDEVQQVVRIARERAALLDRIKSALESGDDREANRLMRVYVGLSPELQRAVGN